VAGARGRPMNGPERGDLLSRVTAPEAARLEEVVGRGPALPRRSRTTWSVCTTSCRGFWIDAFRSATVIAPPRQAGAFWSVPAQACQRPGNPSWARWCPPADPGPLLRAAPFARRPLCEGGSPRPLLGACGRNEGTPLSSVDGERFARLFLTRERPPARRGRPSAYATPPAARPCNETACRRHARDVPAPTFRPWWTWPPAELSDCAERPAPAIPARVAGGRNVPCSTCDGPGRSRPLLCGGRLRAVVEFRRDRRPHGRGCRIPRPPRLPATAAPCARRARAPAEARAHHPLRCPSPGKWPGPVRTGRSGRVGPGRRPCRSWPAPSSACRAEHGPGIAPQL